MSEQEHRDSTPPTVKNKGIKPGEIRAAIVAGIITGAALTADAIHSIATG